MYTCMGRLGVAWLAMNTIHLIVAEKVFPFASNPKTISVKLCWTPVFLYNHSCSLENHEGNVSMPCSKISYVFIMSC